MPLRFKEFDLQITEIEKYRPLINFLSSIPNSGFVRVVNNLTQGYGTGFEGVTACLFPSELDESMVASGEGFENGIQFIDMDEEIVVDINTLWKYLRMACKFYWLEHPEDKATLEEYLSRPKPSLELPPDVAEWIAKWKRGEYSQIAKAS